MRCVTTPCAAALDATNAATAITQREVTIIAIPPPAQS
jgi:hypothetical protein